MLYHNITLDDLVKYFSCKAKEDLAQIYLIVQKFSYEEFRGFMKIQDDTEEAKEYFSERKELIQSVIDKAIQIVPNFEEICAMSNINNDTTDPENDEKVLEMKRTLEFQRQFKLALQLTITPKYIGELVRAYELKNQTLVCNMIKSQILELLNLSQIRTTYTMYTNCFLPIKKYVNAQIALGISKSLKNSLSDIDYRTIDLSETMKTYLFASRKQLVEFIKETCPPVNENSHLNRFVMAMLLVYDGVDTEDVLKLKDSDVQDGVLKYHGIDIPLDDMQKEIMECWKSGKYFMKSAVKTEIKLESSEYLIKTHQPISINFLGNSLSWVCERNNKPKITFSDIERSGKYYRAVFCDQKMKTNRMNKALLENDVRCWMKAFGY